MTKQEAENIFNQGKEAVISKLMEFSDRLKKLENAILTDSTNSSKPPSSDNKLSNTKKIKTSKSSNKKGAQLGHKGNNLKLSNTPNTIKEILPTKCKCCNKSLAKNLSIKHERRQVFDLPNIEINITEYQAHTKQCSKCNTINKASFPENINGVTQYGNNIITFASYCNTYQMLPYKRISELIFDLTSHNISTGVIYNFLTSQYNSTEVFEDKLIKELIKEKVLHSDETGVNVQGKLNWIHVISSSIMTYYMIHQKRGKEAMDSMGILPHYNNILVHDHFYPYNKYSCIHSYCNAHILRELNGIIVKDNTLWSKDMFNLLTNMNIAVHKAS